METRVLKVGCEVLAFVFNMMPQNAQWPGDTKDGVQVIVKNWHSRPAERFGWHADEGKIVHPLEYIFDTIGLENGNCCISWEALDAARRG